MGAVHAVRAGGDGSTPARPSRRPQVVAHRGGSAVEPEHTLAAYRGAIEDGADALECDVRLTRDGHLVCVHDRRVDRTSNGRGPVSTFELADLDELDWSVRADAWSRDDPEQPDRDRSGVLTLERLCGMVADCERPVELAIETKHPTRYAGLVERRLVETLAHFGWDRPRRGASAPVRVMSFSPVSLRRLRAVAPDLPTVLLLNWMPPPLRGGRLPRGVSIAGPGIHVLRAHPGYVERVHAAGRQVHVWTVNDPDDIDLCLRTGVDAVITDRPARVRARLGSREPDAPSTAGGTPGSASHRDGRAGLRRAVQTGRFPLLRRGHNAGDTPAREEPTC